MATNPGTHYHPDGSCRFRVWAPLRESVALQLEMLGEQETQRTIEMDREERGYWTTEVNGLQPGQRYRYLLDGELERADPASHAQPNGVHGPSAIVDHHAFCWHDDDWTGRPLEELIIYELHVGTFTPSGTFSAIIPRLTDLCDLGVTAVELMPVAQFPGTRNWGYDGVYPYAVQDSYGGVRGLKRVVDACHDLGLSVVLDVVYNHLGPEGNYLRDFGPYFTDTYATPWGDALNFDGAHSDAVRDFFIANAQYWLAEFHIDALRLDAIHAIYDQSAKPFLAQLIEETQRYAASTPRTAHVICENDHNDARVFRRRTNGGFGADAQWCDDFHHALHTLLTGESSGYYGDFGTLEDLASAYREGYVYGWRYSQYRKRHHGSRAADIDAKRFVVFAQNHDQTGNRPTGERLGALVGFEALKLAAGATILAPGIPLIFMGEEYDEPAPFLYFVNFNDEALNAAVYEGRQEEYAPFFADADEAAEQLPNPSAASTFARSKLDWRSRLTGENRTLLDFYRLLLQIRKALPAFSIPDRNALTVETVNETVLILHRSHPAGDLAQLMNFGTRERTVMLEPEGRRWIKLVDSKEELWAGPGSKLPTIAGSDEELILAPKSIALYETGHGTEAWNELRAFRLTGAEAPQPNAEPHPPIFPATHFER